MSAPARGTAALPRYPAGRERWPWWRVAEPVTTLTDVALAAWGILLAVRLLAQLPPTLLTTTTAAALLVVGLGAAAGGVVHGLVHQLGERGWLLLWRATLLLAGLANGLLVAAVALALLPRSWAPAVLALLAARWALFARRAWRDYRFRHVVLDSAVALGAIALAQGWAWWARGAPSAPWILGAVAVSVAGGLLQQRGVGVHRHFNHNDLYHMVQGVALWLFYRGGLLLGVAG